MDLREIGYEFADWI